MRRCSTVGHTIRLILMGCLCNVTTGRELCPESNNPLNIQFDSSIREILWNGSIVDIDPVGFERLNPEDVTCETNFEHITLDDFKDAVICTGETSKTAQCEVSPQCSAHRKQYLQRLKFAVLQALDKAVIKIKAVDFFNKFIDAKNLIFGKTRLGNQTGMDIILKATTGKYSILKGFGISNKALKPSLKDFVEEFGLALDLYSKLSQAQPSGLLREPICPRANDNLVFLVQKRIFCARAFLIDMKVHDVDKDDVAVLHILEKSLNLIVSYLTKERRRFFDLRVPFTGPCVSAESAGTSLDYTKLVSVVEALKTKRL